MGFSKQEAPNCDLCKFRNNCFYNFIDRQSQKAWKELRVANRFKSGDSLFYEGEKPSGIYAICQGRIKIYKTSRGGQQLITRIEYPGDLVGHIALFAGGNYKSNAECMGDTVVSFVEYKPFCRFLEEYPRACIALLQALAKDILVGDAKARDIAYKPAKVRMADVLIKSVSARSKGTSKPIVYGIKRRELAEMAGLTVETAVRTLADFERNKLIKRENKAIIILDMEKLDTIVATSL